MNTLTLSCYSEVGGDGLTAAAVDAALAKSPGVKQINLRINSPGGSVLDAIAIHNRLKGHTAKVIVDIDGAALSAASVIAMAGDEIRMASNAVFMIHDPSMMTAGADDLRKSADVLDRLRDNLASIYASRTGHPKSTIIEWMSNETWMDATEAKHLNFITQITGELSVLANGHFDKAPAKIKAIVARSPSSRRGAKTTGDVFTAMVGAKVEAGMSRHKAMRAVVAEQPSLHAAWLREANADRAKAACHH